MSIAALLAALAARGVRMRAIDDGGLRVGGPKDQRLSERELELLRQCKPVILAFLAGRPHCCVCGCAIVEEPSRCAGQRTVHHACGLRARCRQQGGGADDGAH